MNKLWRGFGPTPDTGERHLLSGCASNPSDAVGFFSCFAHRARKETQSQIKASKKTPIKAT